MNKPEEGSTAPNMLAGAQLEAYKRVGDRFTITIKVTEKMYMTIVLDGVISVSDRGWQSITRLTPLVDGVPVRQADLDRGCQSSHDGSVPFTFQLPVDGSASGIEVVAHELSVKRDRVESCDELPESLY